MRDLFNGHPYNGAPVSKIIIEDFRWVVAIFKNNGASEAIIRANKINLCTYYPVHFNAKNEPVPLWKNYLFIEFKEHITLDLCRTTINFSYVLTARDKDGIVRPHLVRRNSVDENRAMVMAGRFNELSIKRKFYGRGHIVRVIEGTFIDKKVRLEENVYPEWRGNHKVTVNIDGKRGVIELYKLAL